MSAGSQPNINDKSPGYTQRFPQWRKVRDVLEGEERIKERSTLYLPKPEGQTTTAYQRYRDRAVFYSISDRTVNGLTGLVFRVAPMIELPDQIDTLTESATPDGNSLDTMLQDAVREVISLGRFGVLVDMPVQPTLTGETVPYLAPYEAETIWRWDEVFDPLAGERKLVRVVVEEEPTTHNDKTVTWLRELFLEMVFDEEGQPTGQVIYKQQLWREVDPETQTANAAPVVTSGEEILAGLEGFERIGEPIVPIMNGAPLSEIPFWFINTFNLLARPSKPPMVDLANMNLAHYRNSADVEQLLHLVGSPTPWASADWDEGQKPLTIGAGTSWMLPKDATVGVLEFSGSSYQAFQSAMQDKENRMAALGARLLCDQDRSNVTAETTRLQINSETSVLINVVSNVEQGFQAALQFGALWAGASEGEVEDLRLNLNRDFFGIPMSAVDLQALVAGWQAGAYSRQTLHENLQRGEIIDPKRTLEEEASLQDEEAVDAPPGTTGGDPFAPPAPPDPPEEPDPDEEDEEDEPAA